MCDLHRPESLLPQNRPIAQEGDLATGLQAASHQVSQQFASSLIQDYCFIIVKRRVYSLARYGVLSLETALRILQGYEVMHQLRKGQVNRTIRGNIESQVRFVPTAFGLAA